jgi:phosphoglucosamine mutase
MKDDVTTETVRAIEAIVLVAHEPVPTDLIAQLLEIPAITLEEVFARLAQDMHDHLMRLLNGGAVNAVNHKRVGEVRQGWTAVAAAEATLGSEGRIVLRASGTEPLVRVMVEARDAVQCAAIAAELVAIVERELPVTD